jgi:hypothetical protein
MSTPRAVRTKPLAWTLVALVLLAPALAPLRAEENASRRSLEASQAAGRRPAAPPAASYPAEADKVHVVLLVYGHKGGISAACQKDCKGLKAALEAAFADDPERLLFYDLSIKNPATDKVYTRDETLAAIKGLKLGKNDNVLVFQSGHGGIGDRNDPEMSHRLVMDGASLTRAQIQRPLEALKPRAIIFLTDCCSGISKKPAAPTEFVSVSEAGPNIETIRNLVLRPVGIVSITAAEDGKLASASFRGANPGKAGSAFTVALLRLWYSDVTYSSWVMFFPALKAETSLASGGRHAARAFQLKDGSVTVAPPTVALPAIAVPVWQIHMWR